MTGGLEFAGANRVIVMFVLPDERVGEIAGINWIPVRGDGIGSKHTANLRPASLEDNVRVTLLPERRPRAPANRLYKWARTVFVAP